MSVTEIRKIAIPATPHDITVHLHMDDDGKFTAYIIPADGARSIVKTEVNPLTARSVAPDTAAILGDPPTFTLVDLNLPEVQAVIDEAQAANRLVNGYENNVATEAKRKRRQERAQKIAAIEAELAAVEADQSADI